MVFNVAYFRYRTWAGRTWVLRMYLCSENEYSYACLFICEGCFSLGSQATDPRCTPHDPREDHTCITSSPKKKENVNRHHHSSVRLQASKCLSGSSYISSIYSIALRGKFTTRVQICTGRGMMASNKNDIIYYYWLCLRQGSTLACKLLLCRRLESIRYLCQNWH